MSARAPVIGGDEAAEALMSTRAVAARMLVVAGAAFSIVGFADLVLLWVPAQPDNLAWEYATVGRTLDMLPMPSLGLLLLAYGVLRSPGVTKRHVLLTSGTFWIFGLLCAFMAFLIFTAAPAVISQSPAGAAEAVRRAATRHGVQSLLYPVAWMAIGWIISRAGSRRAES